MGLEKRNESGADPALTGAGREDPECSDPGSLQSWVTGQPRVSMGEPHHIGTPQRRVTSWLGCPQSLCGPRGSGMALTQVSLGVWRGLRHGGKGRKELFFPCPVAGTQVPGCCCASATGSASRDGTRDGDLLSAPCPPRLGQGTAAGSKDTTWILIFFIHVSTINLPGCSFPDNRIHYDGNILRRTAA